MVFYNRTDKKDKPYCYDDSPPGQDDISDCSSLSQSHFSPETTQPTNTAKSIQIELSEKEETDISIFVQPGGDRTKLPPDLPSEGTITDECSQTGIEVEAVEFSSKKKQVNISNDDRDLQCPRRMMLVIVAFVVIMTASAVVGFWAFRFYKSSTSSSVASLVSSDEVGAEVVDVNTNNSVVVNPSLKDAITTSARDAENDIKEEINNSNVDSAVTNSDSLLWSDSGTVNESELNDNAVASTIDSPAIPTDEEEEDDVPMSIIVPEEEDDPLPVAKADPTPSPSPGPTPPPSPGPTPPPSPGPTPPPSLGPTLEPSISVTEASTTVVTIVVTTDGTSSSNCPDHSLVASSNCAENSATAFSTVLFCFASKRDGDWYWIRGSDDSDDTRGYDIWDYTDETEGQLTLSDLVKGNYLVSLVRDSMRPYDIITTHNL